MLSISSPSNPTHQHNDIRFSKIMAASFLRPSRLDPQDHGYVKSRFSRHGRPVQVLASWLLDVREMRNIERLIVQGTDETVMAFKGSQIGAVGMTAVAVCGGIWVVMFSFLPPFLHRPRSNLYYTYNNTREKGYTV